MHVVKALKISSVLQCPAHQFLILLLWSEEEEELRIECVLSWVTEAGNWTLGHQRWSRVINVQERDGNMRPIKTLSRHVIFSIIVHESEFRSMHRNGW